MKRPDQRYWVERYNGRSIIMSRNYRDVATCHSQRMAERICKLLNSATVKNENVSIKKEALYAAIYEQVMELRIEIAGLKRDGKPICHDGLDSLLHDLVDTIWDRQKGILNLNQ